MTTYTCQNCDWEGDDPNSVDDSYQRFEPGDIYTDAQCPECGALAHSEAVMDEIYRITKMRRALTTLCDAWDAGLESNEVDWEDLEVAVHMAFEALGREPREDDNEQ